MKTEWMKLFGRVGAVLSFSCLIIPGAWLLTHANIVDEPIAIVIGFCLMGNAFFAGTALWLYGGRFSRMD